MNIPAEVVLSRSRSYEVRLLDLSEGGAGIVAPAAAPSGVRFSLRFQLPQRAGMASVLAEVPSRVVHSVFSRDRAGFRIGVQFVDVPEAQLQAIRTYVQG